MDFSSLNSALEISKGLSEETKEFVGGLFMLAHHWDGDEGVQKIKLMMSKHIERGSSTQEAAIDCYHFLKSQVF